MTVYWPCTVSDSIHYKGSHSCAETVIDAEYITEIKCDGVKACGDTLSEWTIDCNGNDDVDTCQMLCTAFAACSGDLDVGSLATFCPSEYGWKFDIFSIRI